MAEYIEREKVYERLNALGGCGAEHETWADGWDKAIDTAIYELNEIPAADVLPVVHGKWSKDMVAVKETAPGYHSDDVRFGFQCSKCGEISSYKTPYCGYCTAKMVLENPIGSNARIVNTGTPEKPYYQIEYRDNNDGTLRLGYGTKDLDIAIHWLNRYFFDSGAKMDGKDGESDG